MSEQTTTLNIRSLFADTVTGYGVIKGTNEALNALGLSTPSGKPLPGPMGYTYLRKGYIVPGVKGIKSCTGDQAAEWASKYIAKLVAKAAASTTPEEAEEVEMTEAMDLEV
jgi:hypothetical protein